MGAAIHQDAEKVSFSMRIKAACSELKLSTLSSVVEDICAQATRRQQSTLEVLALLLEAEVEDRQGRRISRRLKEAGFPRIKTLAEFSFERAPHVPQSIITELFSGAYIQRAQGVILIGDPGTGKTHLATALGVAACNQGRSTRFVSAANLVNDLVEAKDARILGSTVRRYARCELLVIDDLGYLPLANHEADLLFQVFSERTERGSTIITTNLPFSEFTKIFQDKRLCAAVLDRITHNAHIIDTGIESMRGPLTVPKMRQIKSVEVSASV